MNPIASDLLQALLAIAVLGFAIAAGVEGWRILRARRREARATRAIVARYRTEELRACPRRNGDRHITLTRPQKLTEKTTAPASDH